MKTFISHPCGKATFTVITMALPVPSVKYLSCANQQFAHDYAEILKQTSAE
jgi:hypothetical protein